MKIRGRILRDTNAGPGLLAANGQQLPFTLETHWKSATAPSPNQVVDVELDAAGNVLTVTTVDPGQIAREQAEQALVMAKERGGQALAVGGQLLGGLTAAVGVTRLVSVGLLLLSWFVLATIKVRLYGSVANSFTLWDLIPALHSTGGFLQGLQGGSGSRGIFGLLTIAAAFAPLLPGVWKKPAAQLGTAAPLTLLLVLLLYAYFSLQSGLSSVGGDAAGEFAQAMANNLMKEVMKAFSLGLGFYLSLVVSIVLAVSGTRGWQQQKRLATQHL